MNTQPKIGFSFSGGGARAVAQIGMIRAFRESNIEADYVIGTSGGAIVGAMYASRMPIDAMMKFASNGSLFKIYKAGIPIRGITSLDILGEMMEDYMEVKTFEELEISFAVMTANLMTGKKEILDSGNIFAAVMASCSIPFLFHPVDLNGNLYVDGGLFDNMPTVTLEDNCDIIVGMNVMPTSILQKEELDNIFSIGMRVFDMSVAQNSQINYPNCDIIIEPKGVLDYGIFDFGAYEELEAIGYAAAQEHIEELTNKIKGFKYKFGAEL